MFPLSISDYLHLSHLTNQSIIFTVKSSVLCTNNHIQTQIPNLKIFQTLSFSLSFSLKLKSKPQLSHNEPLPHLPSHWQRQILGTILAKTEVSIFKFSNHSNLTQFDLFINVCLFVSNFGFCRLCTKVERRRPSSTSRLRASISCRRARFFKK